MSSPWLRLTRIALLPIPLKHGRLHEMPLYELYPNDPSVRKKIPPPHLPTMIPFFHTVIVYNVPLEGKPAERIKILDDNIPGTLKIDYFWCPEMNGAEQKNGAQELIYIVCYDAKMATAVLRYLPQISCYKEKLTGEIYVPRGKSRWGTNRFREIEAWSDVVFWAGFTGREMVLGVGSRGVSNEDDQDLRWLVGHHVQYMPRYLDGKGEVTVWLSAIERDWKPIQKNGKAGAVGSVTQNIITAIKHKMYCNRNGIGLKLVFEQEKHADLFKTWLSAKATSLVPKRRRKLDKDRWYIHKYV